MKRFWLLVCLLWLLAGCSAEQTSIVRGTALPQADSDTPAQTHKSFATGTPVPKATPPPTIPPQQNQTLVPVPPYEVVEMNDVSMANRVRFTAAVAVEFPVSVEQIKALCTEVVERQKARQALSALTVFVFDTHSSWYSGYSIASCVYAPHGNWDEADRVQPGDYSSHRFSYEYQPKVLDAEAALRERPTEEEARICQRFDEIFYESSVMKGEEEVIRQLGSEFKVTEGAVNDALFRCLAWTFR